MTAEAWIFSQGALSTVFTSDVISFSGRCGRQNYIDNYSGGTFNITIKNQANQIANFSRGTEVQIKYSTGNSFQYGTVIGIDFNDYPGNVGMSTATITCQDEITRAGKFTLQNFTGYDASVPTTTQATYANESFTGFNTPDVLPQGTGSSTAQDVDTYNGTILNRLNLLNNTERGQLISAAAGIAFLSRQSVLTANSVSFNRSSGSATVIAYTALRRIQAGETFMNQVSVTTLTSAGVDAGPYFANNSTSQTAYGIAGYSFQSADAGTEQPTYLAQWMAAVQGDPTLLRYEIDYDDATANTTAILNFNLNAGTFYSPSTSVVWRVPGASADTTSKIVLEGFSFSGTPDRTKYTAYFTDYSVYEYFILNSSTQGILDTSRLGW